MWFTFWMSSLGFEVPVPLRLWVASISRPNMATSSMLVYFLYSLHISICRRSCGVILSICSMAWTFGDVFPSFRTYSPGLTNSTSAVCFEILYVCWSLLWRNESFLRNCNISMSMFCVTFSWDFSEDKSLPTGACCLSSLLLHSFSSSHGLKPNDWFCTSVSNMEELWAVASDDNFHRWLLAFSNDTVTSSDLGSSCVLVSDPANTINYTFLPFPKLMWSIVSNVMICIYHY